jgi:hypothetical protein
MPAPGVPGQPVVSVFSSRLLPAFIGRNFFTTTGSSATSHRIVPPGSPLELRYLQPLLSENDMRLPQLPRTPGKLRHPQSPNGTDQVSGFALFCTLTLPSGRIRFTCAMGSLLPIASFRPCRCRQRPCDSDCLPLGRGDACCPPCRANKKSRLEFQAAYQYS